MFDVFAKRVPHLGNCVPSAPGTSLMNVPHTLAYEAGSDIIYLTEFYSHKVKKLTKTHKGNHRLQAAQKDARMSDNMIRTHTLCPVLSCIFQYTQIKSLSLDTKYLSTVAGTGVAGRADGECCAPLIYSLIWWLS